MSDKANKYIYFFEEGNGSIRDRLGGKGAGLAEMTSIGLPVPPGFTITTDVCKEYYLRGKRLPDGLENGIFNHLELLEARTGKRMGDPENPLLVSVRSGAPISMPGMMDTILNLGLNDSTVIGLSRLTGNEWFAYDCYRRFIQMFCNVVLGMDISAFEEILESHKRSLKIQHDQEIPIESLKRLVQDYKSLVLRDQGRAFPNDTRQQLLMAVEAVFKSWNNQRAIVYRKINGISDDLGTAVNIQAMVFGNMGEDCATGVMFTRDPNTGEKVLYGEYLTNAQGEDVVAGIRTPMPISRMKEQMPEAFTELQRISTVLENHYADMQDIEFTIEHGKVYMLQTRAGKRSALAAVKIAHDMVLEGLIDKAQAIKRIEADHIVRLLHRGIDPEADVGSIAAGLPASPGAATGAAVFDADRAEELGLKGEKVILVRPETTPEDMHGVVYSQGILTSRGGMTCHAAIVARGMGKPCVVGCEALQIDVSKKQFSVGAVAVREEDLISIDGATGKVFLGEVPMIEPKLNKEFEAILDWCDEVSRLTVRANADTPEDAMKAREFGAKGIGLCRTEHMFMAQDRLPVVQEMILAETVEERRKALDRLMPMQKEDFKAILRAMRGYPVTIRLLDPPLHEFLPDIEELVVEIGQMRAQGRPDEEIAPKEEILRKARSLYEMNPMLGFRGCRLGVIYPEIYEMQICAIFLALIELRQAGVTDAHPEIMMPLIGTEKELEYMRNLVCKVAKDLQREHGVSLDVPVGTMIEVPRAALTADEIANQADFFSFGTNDLTQTTFGFSRDDAEGKFLPEYIKKKILPQNPFSALDQAGVGKLMRIAVDLGRRTKPGLKMGICGEHGGEPSSIAFCHKIGLDYVSCSPYRVPVARLAAAQAKINETP